jgi:hypothetical protein
MKLSYVVAMLALGSTLFMSSCKNNSNSNSNNPTPNNPPTVSSSNISNQATGVPTNKDIAVTFSEPMDQSTITTSTFFVKKGTTLVPGTVSYSGTTATFNPSVALDPNTLYTATVTTGVKDVSGLALASNVSWSFTTGSTSATLAVVNLRTAGNYVLLAKSAISNVPTSSITGWVALSPAAASFITGLSIVKATGYATSAQVTGNIYAADMAAPTPSILTTAISDMQTAYTDAAGRSTPNYLELGTGNIGGKTLLPGLYKWTSSVTAPTNVTISGGANDVWIFQTSGDLSLAAGVRITLAGGAQAKNIFWQVAGTVTTGTTSHLEGIVLCKTSITFNANATFKGRALAQTAIVLNSNTIVTP